MSADGSATKPLSDQVDHVWVGYDLPKVPV